MNFETQFTTYRQHIHQTLQLLFKDIATPTPQLYEAIQYSLLNGGKRIRGSLILSVGQMLSAKVEDLIYLAVAVEMMHAYSLVHDDLPAMDNSDLRRGMPTSHKIYGDAIAILVGDALQAWAFEIICEKVNHLPADKKLQIIHLLAKACGPKGMVAGQILDIAPSHKITSLADLSLLHQLKTGAFIKACILMGAVAANCQDDSALQALSRFAEHLGLAFQIQDDLLDILSDETSLGKPLGLDVKNEKITFVSLLGIDTAKEKLKTELEGAHQALNYFTDKAAWLHQLTDFIGSRIY